MDINCLESSEMAGSEGFITNGSFRRNVENTPFPSQGAISAPIGRLRPEHAPRPLNAERYVYASVYKEVGRVQLQAAAHPQQIPPRRVGELKCAWHFIMHCG